jgi:hypothetical protein
VEELCSRTACFVSIPVAYIAPTLSLVALFHTAVPSKHPRTIQKYTNASSTHYHLSAFHSHVCRNLEVPRMLHVSTKPADEKFRNIRRMGGEGQNSSCRATKQIRLACTQYNILYQGRFGGVSRIRVGLSFTTTVLGCGLRACCSLGVFAKRW